LGHIRSPWPDPSQYGTQLTFRYFSVMGNLGAQPIAAGKSKEPTQAQIRIGSNRPFPGNDSADSLCWYINFLRQPILTNPHGRQELLAQEFARCNRHELAHNGFTSVIIDNLYICGTCSSPLKADPPLIVDANTVLAGPFSLQGFKAIAGRHFQVTQPGGDIELPQLPPCHSFDVHEPLDPIPAGKCFSIRALERPNHRL